MVRDGLSGGNRPDAWRKKAVHVLGADLQPGVVAKKMIARRKTADDDDVRAEIFRNGLGHSLQHGAGRNKFHAVVATHSGRPLVAGKELRNSSAWDSSRASC